MQSCANTVGESALKVDSETKIPCCDRESNLHQQCAEPDAQPTELHPAPHPDLSNQLQVLSMGIHVRPPHFECL